MRLIISKKTETGKKLMDYFDKVHKERLKLQKIIDELGGNGTYASWPDIIVGRVTAIGFDENPDPKIWAPLKRTHNCYKPKKNTKAGKEIVEKFKTIGSVGRQEMHDILGIKAPFLAFCGYCIKDDKFGFNLNDDWDVSALTSDAEEVTVAEFKEIFEKK